ncbi:BsuBI/PstI family type II restriction endonuclease [Verrucomicrobium spinosum]|nr:BsuBI/PstI family type II restriction endonuclease [Verrucomicrobium spinosum]
MAGKNKAASVRRVVNEAIEVLQALGVPLSSATQRSREMTAMCFLAVAGVTHSADWPSAAKHPGPPLGTRQIIDFINRHFEESISRGSYDDIRRKHLKLAILAGIVLKSAAKPHAAANDPTRGYAVNPLHAPVIQSFGQLGWAAHAAKFMEGQTALTDVVGGKSSVAAISLVLPNGSELRLGPGQHNALQRAVVEQFRPRFAPGSLVLYLGDAQDRTIVCDTERLTAIGLPLATSGSLPDIILLDEARGWLFLIEAVHSFGPISPERLLTLDQLCQNCSIPRVYVTSFLDRGAFRKFAPDIAWETEVWIASEPDHMIHFNGDRFFGPR